MVEKERSKMQGSQRPGVPVEVGWGVALVRRMVPLTCQQEGMKKGLMEMQEGWSVCQQDVI